MGYKGRMILLAIALTISVGLTMYDYANSDLDSDLPALKWVVIGGVIVSLLFWWLGKQYDKVRYYAQTDILTGAYNRLFSTVMFSRLLKRTERTNEKLNVFLVDINNLIKSMIYTDI